MTGRGSSSERWRVKEEQCEGVRRRRLSNCIAWREREREREGEEEGKDRDTENEEWRRKRDGGKRERGEKVGGQSSVKK